MTSYLDFDIEIGEGAGREYPVVVRSPAGEARATMQFPFDELALENRLLVLQNVLLRSGGKRRLALSQDEVTVQEFGKALFDAALVDDARSLFYECRRLADQQGAGVRVRLRLASPTLAALPWEFLYDTRQGHVSLSVNTPVVRYLELPQPPQPLAVAPPLRILGMIASPSDLPDLDLERERARLERATAELQEQGLVELVWLEGQTWRDLQRALQRGPWHIFHFAGHGAFDPNTDEGLVMLADDEGRSRSLRATELGRLLADHRPLRLAVLNACEGGRGSQRDIFSSTASILVRAGLPAVVAMQYEITDLAAIELTRAFYEALANGLPVDAALAEARKAVSLAVANSFEWGTPVLYMRAPDGLLFDLARAAPPVPAPVAVAVAAEAAAEPVSPIMQPEAPEPAPQTAPAGPVVAEPFPVPAAPEPGQPSRRRLWLAIAGLAIALAIIGVIASRSRIIPGIQSLGMGALSGKVALTADGALVKEPVGMDLVRVPEGEFLMGSDPAKDPMAITDEDPQLSVTMAEFYIGLHEVTNAQYEAFVVATGHVAPEHWDDGRIPVGLEDHPVANVSWDDAVAFTQWLGEETGLDFRLCTEAEWEKACRGDAGAIYPWGDAFDADLANTVESGIEDTTEVDAFSPDGDGPYGVAGMSGNVQEWVADWYDGSYYDYAPVENPPGPESGSERVTRGGSFWDDERAVRCAFRTAADPANRSAGTGFRVCVSPP